MLNFLLNLLWPFICGLIGAFIYAWITNFRKYRAERRAKEKPVEIETSRQVPEFAQVIEGKRYSTLDAHCIAQGAGFFGWWWLMQTQRNNYFTVVESPFGTNIGVRSKEDAIQFFTTAPKREVKFEDAFPDVKIIDA